MATPITTELTEDSTRSSQTSSDSFELSRQTANRKKTKFVVRKIPQFVTEDEIKTHLEEFTDKYDWFLFTCQPKKYNPTRQNKINYNRFYINFKSFDDAIPFVEKFQKLTFQKPQPKPEPEPEPEEEKKTKDNKDNTIIDVNKWAKYGPNMNRPRPNPIHKICVEFAPNQSIPIVIENVDRRIGSIEKDNEYTQFCQSLEDKKKEVKTISKQAEQSLIRRNVISLKKKPKTDSKSESKEENNEKKEERKVAPLAEHVATKRHRRQLYKKINRAALVKTEKAKTKEIERVRETRRRKRIALAKAAKYGKKQWVAKKESEQDRDRDVKDDRRDRRDRRDDRDDRYYNDWDHEYENVRRRKGYGRGSGKAYRGRGRGKRGRGGYYGDDGHFSGYSRRKGPQTWKAK